MRAFETKLMTYLFTEQVMEHKTPLFVIPNSSKSNMILNITLDYSGYGLR